MQHPLRIRKNHSYIYKDLHPSPARPRILHYIIKCLTSHVRNADCQQIRGRPAHFTRRKFCLQPPRTVSAIHAACSTWRAQRQLPQYGAALHLPAGARSPTSARSLPKTPFYHTRFVVLAAVKTQCWGFRVVTPCGLVGEKIPTFRRNKLPS